MTVDGPDPLDGWEPWMADLADAIEERAEAIRYAFDHPERELRAICHQCGGTGLLFPWGDPAPAGDKRGTACPSPEHVDRERDAGGW